MASKAIVAILTIFAVGTLVPRASAQVSAGLSANVNLSLSISFGFLDLSGIDAALLQALGNFTANNQAAVGSAIAGVNSSATTAAAELTSFLGNLLNQTQSGAVQANQTVVTAITAVQSAAANQTAQINNGTQAALAAIQNLANVTQGRLNDTTAFLQSALTNLTKAITAQPLVALFNQPLLTAIKNLQTAIANGDFNSILLNILPGTDNQTITLQQFLTALQTNATSAQTTILKQITGPLALLPSLTPALNAGITFGNNVTSALTGVTNALGGAVNATELISILNQAAQGVGGGLGQALAGVGSALSSVLNGVTSVGGLVISGLGNVIVALATGLGSTIAGAGTTLGGAVSGLGTTLGGIIGGLGASIIVG